MANPWWHLGPPSWFLEDPPPRVEIRTLPRVAMRSREDGAKILYGRFAAPGEWAEINSRSEGHYLERMGSNVFEKSIAEDRDRIRCLYHHGLDPFFGVSPLGPIRSLEPDTSYEVDLIDTDYNKRLLPLLKSGELGASFRFNVVRDELEKFPTRSADNPKRLPRVTVTEAKLIEFGPTPLPAYKGATAGVRSTREVVVEVSNSAHRLGPGERWAIRSKPGAPGIVERQRVSAEESAAWEKGRPSWLLEEGEPSWLLEPAPTGTWVLR